MSRIVREELGYAADPSIVAGVIVRGAAGSLVLVAESGGEVLGSRAEREAAHRFYEARGYLREKTHARFAKKL
jgi:hypothetical protein